MPENTSGYKISQPKQSLADYQKMGMSTNVTLFSTHYVLARSHKQAHDHEPPEVPVAGSMGAETAARSKRFSCKLEPA